jgi:Asp-tRNA(Asn)/Glu-tRNA(Gln) amidotransferase A subunit family amidase
VSDSRKRWVAVARRDGCVWRVARIPADMDTDPEVIALVRTAADHLASAGYDVTEANVPDSSSVTPSLFITSRISGSRSRAGNFNLSSVPAHMTATSNQSERPGQAASYFRTLSEW